jgi:hypothetical protein
MHGPGGHLHHQIAHQSLGLSSLPPPLHHFPSRWLLGYLRAAAVEESAKMEVGGTHETEAETGASKAHAMKVRIRVMNVQTCTVEAGP